MPEQPNNPKEEKEPSAEEWKEAHETGAIDILKKMWLAQMDLNTTTFENNPPRCTDHEGKPLAFTAILAAGARVRDGLIEHPDELSIDDTANIEKWVLNYITALEQECSELRDSTNWKWWRSQKDSFDIQNIWVELIDMLHFWMSACMVAGLNPDDILRMYAAKNKVNFDRQDSGYAVKDKDDSKHIAPARREPDPALKILADAHADSFDPEAREKIPTPDPELEDVDGDELPEIETPTKMAELAAVQGVKERRRIFVDPGTHIPVPEQNGSLEKPFNSVSIAIRLAKPTENTILVFRQGAIEDDSLLLKKWYDAEVWAPEPADKELSDAIRGESTDGEEEK